MDTHSPGSTCSDTSRQPVTEAGDVRTVVLSHLHFDHTGHIHHFPNATFVVQEREMSFWFGRHAGRGEFAKLLKAEDTRRGTRASDATHFYANIEEDKPHAIVHTLPEVYDACDRINQLAGSPDRIVAGHDRSC